jgi:hypothetical protein
MILGIVKPAELRRCRSGEGSLGAPFLIAGVGK